MTTHHENLDQYFHQVWQVFIANMGSLRLFSEQISQVADQLDHEQVQEMAEAFADVFGDDPLEVKKELLEFLLSLDDLDIYPNFIETTNIREAFQAFQDNAFQQRVIEWSRDNINKSQKLFTVLNDYLAQPPANGILLRRSALVSLVGFLDVLFESLFYGYCFYVDLENGSDIEKLKETARKKAQKDKRSRNGWAGRVENFSKLDIHFEIPACLIEELTEITNRRNVIVHKNGVIDENYMKYVDEECRPAEADKGKMIVVSTKYLMRAFYVFTVIAFTLSQACWRQWQPNKSKNKANETVERFIYRNLRKERYELVVDLVKIAKNFELPWQKKQVVIVNHAIALRELGNHSGVLEVVAPLSAKKRDWRINIGLAILREDYEKARLLIIRAAKENKLSEVSRYWPVFKPIVNEMWFQNIFVAADRGELPS